MRRTILLLGAALACIAGGGLLIARTWHLSYAHGLFCAIGTASTVGCDASPPGAAGRWAAVAVMLTAIPLLAAVFARLTGHHAAGRLHRLQSAATDALRDHSAALDARMTTLRDELTAALVSRLDQHHGELARRLEEGLDLAAAQHRLLTAQAERHHAILLGAVAAAASPPAQPAPVPGAGAERLAGQTSRPRARTAAKGGV